MTDATAIVFVLIIFKARVDRTHVNGWVGGGSFVSYCYPISHMENTSVYAACNHNPNPKPSKGGERTTDLSQANQTFYIYWVSGGKVVFF